MSSNTPQAAGMSNNNHHNAEDQQGLDVTRANAPRAAVAMNPAMQPGHMARLRNAPQNHPIGGPATNNTMASRNFANSLSPSIPSATFNHYGNASDTKSSLDNILESSEVDQGIFQQLMNKKPVGMGNSLGSPSLLTPPTVPPSIQSQTPLNANYSHSQSHIQQQQHFIPNGSAAANFNQQPPNKQLKGDQSAMINSFTSSGYSKDYMNQMPYNVPNYYQQNAQHSPMSGQSPNLLQKVLQNQTYGHQNHSDIQQQQQQQQQQLHQHNPSPLPYQMMNFQNVPSNQPLYSSQMNSNLGHLSMNQNRMMNMDSHNAPKPSTPTPAFSPNQHHQHIPPQQRKQPQQPALRNNKPVAQSSGLPGDSSASALYFNEGLKFFNRLVQTCSCNSNNGDIRQHIYNLITEKINIDNFLSDLKCHEELNISKIKLFLLPRLPSIIRNDTLFFKSMHLIPDNKFSKMSDSNSSPSETSLPNSSNPPGNSKMINMPNSLKPMTTANNIQSNMNYNVGNTQFFAAHQNKALGQQSALHQINKQQQHQSNAYNSHQPTDYNHKQVSQDKSTNKFLNPNHSISTKNILANLPDAPNIDIEHLNKIIISISSKTEIVDVSSDVPRIIAHALHLKLSQFVHKLYATTNHRMMTKKEPVLDSESEAKGFAVKEINNPKIYMNILNQISENDQRYIDAHNMLNSVKSMAENKILKEALSTKTQGNALINTRAAMEAEREREANKTAMDALKSLVNRHKSDLSSKVESTQNDPTQMQVIYKSTKKDLIYVLEHDKNSQKSLALYQSHLI